MARALVLADRTGDYAHLPGDDGLTLCGIEVVESEPTHRYLQCGACLLQTPEGQAKKRQLDARDAATRRRNLMIRPSPWVIYDPDGWPRAQQVVDADTGGLL